MSIFGRGGIGSSLFSRIRAIDFNEQHVVHRILILAPLFFGIWSVILGQDANYDLYNYHFYNAFAYLNNKLSTDFAPAGSQTYFNPSLDIGYYFLITHLPPRLVGFFMGCLHGLAFVLIYGIARKALAYLPAEDKFRIPMLLAVAACFTGNFFSAIGNTMGDNTTALFNLAALWLLLACWELFHRWSWKAVLVVTVAGLVAGAGIGLKLTNAVFALALCASLLWHPATVRLRIGFAFLFGIAVLLGLALSGGYWFWEMWHEFRNPLFPQFSAFFPNDLTRGVNVADLRWRPRDLLETVFWPFILTIFPSRVGEGRMHQFIWALVYLQLIVVGIKWLYGKSAATVASRMDARSRYIVVYVVLGFILWMELFSIYRYIVSIEMLAPLVAYILFNRLFSGVRAWRLTYRTILASALLVLLGGSSTWGHEGWAEHPFHAELPVLENPAKTMIILPGGDPPFAWLAVMFPKEVSFAQLSAYPGGPGFSARMNEMTSARSDALYAVFEGRYDSRVESIARANATITRLRLNERPSGCNALRWMAATFRLRAEVTSNATGPLLCQLQARAADLVNVEAENLAIRDKKRPLFAPDHLKLIDDSCRTYKAGIGSGVKTYQLCKLERLQ